MSARVGVRVPGGRDRRVLAHDRGLAGGQEPAHRPGAGRARAGDLAARRASRRADPHSDRGSQYTAIRYAERLAEVDAVASVGSVGHSYDNALAESTIGLIKTELLEPGKPWRGLDDVEFALLGYTDWFNNRRIHHEIGRIPPAELEANYYAERGQLQLAGLN